MLLISFIFIQTAFSQPIDPWKITAMDIDPSKYYGVTVANGMIGLVSSPEPFKVKEIVLAGAYDLYGRGRVSNFIPAFNSNHPDPLNEAERLTIFASLQGVKRLIEYHNTAWDELWKSDITIEGDPQLQQDVHNMLYHLYSFIREGTAYSPSPIALSGLGYNGHVFWDLEFGYPIPARLPRGIYSPEVGGGTSFLKFIN